LDVPAHELARDLLREPADLAAEPGALLQRPLRGDRPEPLGLGAGGEPHLRRALHLRGEHRALAHLLLQARVERLDVDFVRRLRHATIVTGPHYGSVSSVAPWRRSESGSSPSCPAGSAGPRPTPASLPARWPGSGSSSTGRSCPRSQRMRA